MDNYLTNWERAIMEADIREAIRVFETNTHCRVVDIEIDREILGVTEGEKFVSTNVHCEIEDNNKDD